MKSQRNQSTAGFTLLEVAGASSLLMVGFVALAGVYVSVARQSEQVTAQNRISSAIRYVLEEIRSADVSTLATNYDGNVYELTDSGPTLVESSTKDRITVAIDSTTNPNLYEVTLTVDWATTDASYQEVVGTKIYVPNE